MNQEECIIPIVTLDLLPQCLYLVYVISNTYMLVQRTITVTGEGDDAAARQVDEKNKGVIFKNCPSFVNCKGEINNKEIDNAKDTDIVMSMYNFTQYCEVYRLK